MTPSAISGQPAGRQAGRRSAGTGTTRRRNVWKPATRIPNAMGRTNAMAVRGEPKRGMLGLAPAPELGRTGIEWFNVARPLSLARSARSPGHPRLLDPLLRQLPTRPADLAPPRGGLRRQRRRHRRPLAEVSGGAGRRRASSTRSAATTSVIRSRTIPDLRCGATTRYRLGRRWCSSIRTDASSATCPASRRPTG